jgi:hypothetical protein
MQNVMHFVFLLTLFKVLPKLILTTTPKDILLFVHFTDVKSEAQLSDFSFTTQQQVLVRMRAKRNPLTLLVGM